MLNILIDYQSNLIPLMNIHFRNFQKMQNQGSISAEKFHVNVNNFVGK